MECVSHIYFQAHCTNDWRELSQMGLREMFQSLSDDAIFLHSLLIFCTHTLLGRPPVCSGQLAPSTKASDLIREFALSLATFAPSSRFPGPVFRWVPSDICPVEGK